MMLPIFKTEYICQVNVETCANYTVNIAFLWVMYMQKIGHLHHKVSLKWQFWIPLVQCTFLKVDSRDDQSQENGTASIGICAWLISVTGFSGGQNPLLFRNGPMDQRLDPPMERV